MEQFIKKVSIIIPAYNVEAYISECLDSILCQTLSDIEIICIDDLSTDSTWDILSEYSRQNNNILLIRQEKEGPGVARNKGIQRASGKYVCMMDADDYYPDSNVLEKLYFLAEENSALLCGGNIVDEYPDGRREPTLGNFEAVGFHDSRIEPRLYGQTRFLYKRSFLFENDIKYLPYVRFEDPPFVLKSILKAKKYYTITDYVYVRRTGYKKPKTDYNIAIGVLSGILDCIKTARKYDLVEFYREEMEILLENCNVYFHPFAASGDTGIWELINQIIAIPDGWTDRRREFPSTHDEYLRYIDNCFEVKRICKQAKRIVLYGAGKVAEMLLKYKWIDNTRIESVVVSKKESDKLFEGHSLKEISEYSGYKGDAVFILAGSEKNTAEMERKIRECHIENYVVVTPRIISFVEDVCGETNGDTQRKR